VAFHVEISSGFRQRARAFNLDDGKLRREVLDPWMRGRPIELGDKRWEPRDCKLIILEGPELAETDLSMGRGWANAVKTASNVTRELVQQATGQGAGPVVAVLAETDSALDEIAAILERLGLQTAPWTELRAAILGAASQGGPGYAAVLAIETPAPPGSWLFDAGLARGALGPRAVVAQLAGGGIPVELAGVDVIRLDPEDEASAQALKARLAK
jgi:hypothetical protein